MNSFGLEDEDTVTLPAIKISHNKRKAFIVRNFSHYLQIHAYGSAVFGRFLTVGILLCFT
jgi:hypothetical protein